MSKCLLYADDTTMLFGGPRTDLQLRVSDSMAALQDWLSVNNFILNSDKTVFVQFLTRNKKPDSISLDQFQIKEDTSVKFLGLTVDSSLSWSSHILQLCSRLSRVSYALRTLQPILDPKSLLTVYHGCFSSAMTYGIEV